MESNRFERPWYKDFTGGSGLRTKIYDFLATVRQESHRREPEVIAAEREEGIVDGLKNYGRNPRGVLHGIEVLNDENRGRIQKMHHRVTNVEQITLDGGDVRLHRGATTYRGLWAVEKAYTQVRAWLEGHVLSCCGDMEKAVQAALLDLIPHKLDVVSLLWRGERVLMQIHWKEGSEDNPAATLRFPTDHAFPCKTVEDVHRGQFATPFQKPGKRFVWDDGTFSVWPERPEAVIVRRSRVEFDGIDRWYQFWQEENIKLVWVPFGVLTAFHRSGDNSDLVKHLRVLDEKYRNAARPLIGEVVNGEYRKSPIKSIIAVSDHLGLDDTAKLVLDGMLGQPALQSVQEPALQEAAQ